jgi:hypothetical protein
MKLRRQARACRSGRTGFIIIFGWRVIAPRDGSPPQELTCPECREQTRFVGRLRRTWFTLFFIPVLPLDSAEAGERVCQCTACKATFEYPLEQMARKAGVSGKSDWQDAIGLYNHLRDNPADSATLLKLLEAYESMGEPGEAAAAARHFPQAYQASEQCQKALARITAAAPPL